MGGPARILYVDADAGYRDRLAARLREGGWQVALFEAVAQAEMAAAADPQPVLLLGGLARDAAPPPFCPCLVLTDDEAGSVAALERGADDCIRRTASLPEIVARLRAVLRRRDPRSGWRFVPERRALTRPDGSAVPLTTAEFNLMLALVRRQGVPVSRAELFPAVFARRFDPSDRAIDNLVAKLRGKLGDTGRPPAMIRSVRPVGYVFTGFGEG